MKKGSALILFILTFSLATPEEVFSLVGTGGPSNRLRSVQLINVPLDHYAYPFIERFETKGYIDGILTDSRPLSRQEIALAIAQVMEKASEGRPISRAEKGLIEDLKIEFADELARLKNRGRAQTFEGTGSPPGPARQKYTAQSPREPSSRPKSQGENPPPTRWHLYTWRDEEQDSYLVLDPVLRVGYVGRGGEIGPSPDRVLVTVKGGMARGVLKGSFGFYLNTRDTEEKGNKPFASYADLTSRHGLPITLHDENSVSYDETDAYVVIPLKWFQLEFGKQFNNWGPGHWGNLALSDYAPSFESFKIKAQYGRLKFTGLTGTLRTELPEYSYDAPYSGFHRVVRKQKFIAAHRAEFMVGPNVRIGANEVIIYGERGVEVGYLIPIIFYWSEQHYIYGDDNAALGFDITIKPMRNLKTYLEVFIDDLSLKHFDLSRGDNKWAILAGTFMVDPFGISDSDFRVEYVRVEPYVYTHRVPINVYENHGYVLGHRIGPNSDGLFVELNHRFSRGLLGTVSFERIRHGRNLYDEDGEMVKNVGGDINFPIEYRSDGRKRFLDGILERRSTLSLSLSYRTFQDLFFTGELSYTRTTDELLGKSRNVKMMLSVGYNFYQ